MRDQLSAISRQQIKIAHSSWLIAHSNTKNKHKKLLQLTAYYAFAVAVSCELSAMSYAVFGYFISPFTFHLSPGLC
jgi:hypothetical protein